MSIALRLIVYAAVIGIIVTFALNAPDLPTEEIAPALAWAVSTARTFEPIFPVALLIKYATLMFGIETALWLIRQTRRLAAAVSGGNTEL